jgi:pimeloyl-ACP methyl ester carboxylesterase
MTEVPARYPALSRLAGEPGRGDVLVLGAGLGTASRTLWGAVAERLGDRYECLGLDLPGHGGARPAAGPFTVEELAAHTRLLGEKSAGEAGAAAGRTVWYAGVSLGGAVALALAADPGPFRGVVVVAAASTLGNPEMWHERAALVRAEGTPVMVAGSAERWFGPGFAERDGEIFVRMMQDLSETDDESYAQCCETLAAHDLRPVLAAARLPVLLLAGEQDPIVSSARMAVDAAALPGSSIRVLAGVAHEPPAEAPQQVAGLMAGFFDEVRDQEPAV